MSEKIVLIDGHSILNRAYFGLPDLTNSEGLHTNAVYGFLNILFKILEEEKPQYLTVAFDVHAPTFRHQMFDGYKGTRKPMAEELRQQVPLMKKMLSAMGVMIVEKEGYEADDILGTLSVMAENAGMEVSVISGDRDLLQLATEHVQIRIPKTKRSGTEIENYYAADVKERYLVTPKEFIDVKALQGDASDNIPGVPGIGEKTAGALIAQYGSIEAVFEHAEEIKPPRAGKNIVAYWEQAVMSKQLATIITNAPISYEFSKARIEGSQSLYTEEAYILCKELEFKNLLGRFTVEGPKNTVEDHFTLIRTGEEAEKIWQKAKGRQLGFWIVENATGIEGISVAFSEEDCYFMQVSKELEEESLLMSLRESVNHAKMLITRDLKKQLSYFSLTPEKDWKDYKKKRDKFRDVAIAAYLINPLIGDYPYEDIAKEYLNLLLPSKQDIMGKKTVEEGKKEPEFILKWACYEAYVAWKAYGELIETLQKQKMDELYLKMEMPLAFVLFDMEREGICMDAKALADYGEKLSVSIKELEKKIYNQAGEEFNINSPKQLGVILFEKLSLPNGKKTKTGYSTAADVLEKLAGDYPIVSDILEYRQLAKLKSTYADGLLSYVEEDGRIHTTFHQTITATGRLSSADPNLQNIPIRIELGKLIRKVFHPKEDYLFLDSDYSQIELRILAHMSGDEQMIEAFRNKQDIHSTTASQVFHVPLEEVTSLQRRNAKAVNFGIVYGISAFGLSQDLDISRKEAQEFIDRYYETYPKIKEFLDKTVEQAKEEGAIRTMFQRVRPIPELKSSNFMQRQFGERVAMNSPIQGTAADIIKIAMIRVHDRLYEEGLKSRLILQVHDELLVEVAPSEKEVVHDFLEKEMKNAVNLSIEMDVDSNFGYNWYDAH